MAKLFGTDGMRGEAGVFPLDPSSLETAGFSVTTHLKNNLGRAPVFVIGRDTRESGGWIERALVSGIAKAGGTSKSAGIITTPGVAFLTRTVPADAGIVISASHNAYQDNGIKIFSPSGRKLDEETERLIERDIFLSRETAIGNAVIAPEPVNDSNDVGMDLRTQYLDYLSSEIGKGMSLTDVRLIVDCANGAVSQFAGQLFQRLGASVTSINNNPDGRNINLRCGSLHMESLQQEMINQGADLGVAFDGDADRSLFVDSKGQLVNGDASLWVLGNYLKARDRLHRNTVVATVMSNIGLEIAFKTQGISLVRTDVGDKFVLESLLESGASLGGEQSGHIIFPTLSLAGDGMITTLFLLRAMMEDSKALHELTTGFQTFPQILVNVEVKAKPPFNEIEAIQKVVNDVETKLGLRGRLLLRYSGTESLARIMLEGESQIEIQKYADELKKVIEKSLGVSASSR